MRIPHTSDELRTIESFQEGKVSGIRDLIDQMDQIVLVVLIGIRHDHTLMIGM